MDKRCSTPKPIEIGPDEQPGVQLDVASGVDPRCRGLIGGSTWTSSRNSATVCGLRCELALHNAANWTRRRLTPA
jgi:hypothetical protein